MRHLWILAALAVTCPEEPDDTDVDSDVGSDVDTDADTEVEAFAEDTALFPGALVVGGVEVREATTWTLSADGVAVMSGRAYVGDELVGSAIVRLSDPPVLIAGPDDLEAVFGNSSASAGITGDRDGFLSIASSSGCVGSWDGVLREVACPTGTNVWEDVLGVVGVPTEGGVGAVLGSRGAVADRRWEILVHQGSSLGSEAWEGAEPPGGDLLGFLSNYQEARIGTDGELWLRGDGADRDGVLTQFVGAISMSEGTADLAGYWRRPSGQPLDQTVGFELAPESAQTFGTPFRSILVPGDGGIAWLAAIRSGDGVDPSSGIYGRDAFGAPRAHAVLAQPLPTVSGTSAVRFTGNQRVPALAYDVDNLGRAWVSAWLEDDTSGLWRFDQPNEPIPVARTGDPVPGPDGRPLDGLTFGTVGSFVASGGDTVAFAASVQGEGVDETNDLGIWATSSQGVRLLVRMGEPAPGVEYPVRTMALNPMLPLPDQRSFGRIPTLGIPAVNTERGHAAYGSRGTNSTVATTECGDVLVRVGDGVTQALVRYVADPSCQGGFVVNDVADTPDTNPGDGRCDVGGAAIDGRRPCTVRAAFQEAEARPGTDYISFDLSGSGPHEVILTRALPPLTQPLQVLADGTTVILRGGPDIAGLATTATLTLSGIHLADFATDGLTVGPNASFTGYRLDVSGSCGWGIVSDSVVSLADGSSIANNGTGPGCEGGGILASHLDPVADQSARLFDVAITNNGGPGILANASVIAEDVRVIGNDGPGIAIVPDDLDTFRFRLQSRYGDVTVQDNAGDGISVGNGGILSRGGSYVVTGNGGWGLYLDQGQLRFLDSGFADLSGSHAIRDNGSGDTCSRWDLSDGNPSSEEVPCEGGGVFISMTTAEPDPSQIGSVAITGNAGPGIYTEDRLVLEGADIQDNDGSGVWVTGDNLTGEQTALRFRLRPSTVSGNANMGVRVGGRVSVEQPLVVQDNRGTGLHVEPLSIATGQHTQVRNNGDGDTCIAWSRDAFGFLARALAVCQTGGILVDDGDLVADHLDVVHNTGVGITATGVVLGNGDVTVSSGQLCGNSGGDVDAEGAVVLGEDVVRVCE